MEKAVPFDSKTESEALGRTDLSQLVMHHMLDRLSVQEAYVPRLAHRPASSDKSARSLQPWI